MKRNRSLVTLHTITELLARYFRYSVDGFERLRRPGPKLLVGYHGRPIAWDLFILAGRMNRYLGRPPLSIAHRALFDVPVVGRFFEEIGAIADDDAAIQQAVAEGQSMLVAPGGELEFSRNALDRHRVRWRGRRGYLRRALEFRIPIIPVGAYGVDLPYLNLADGLALGRAIGLPRSIPLTLALGPTGLLPFSPPFPTRIHQIIGAPIVFDEDPDPSKERLEELNDIVVARVQSNIDEARRLVRRLALPGRPLSSKEVQ